MIRNFILVAFRNLSRHKFFTVINGVGLALSLAVALFIYSYIKHELSYDQFHSNADRIVRATVHYQNDNGYDIHFARTNMDWINNLDDDFAYVNKVIRFQDYQPRDVKVGTDKYKLEHAYSTDPEVFELFDFKLTKGNPATALVDPYSVVLTESTALKLFGSVNVLNKEVEIFDFIQNKLVPHAVRGVMSDLPNSTHMPVNLLTSINKPEDWAGWSYTYLLLDHPSDVVALEKGLPEFIIKYAGAEDAPDISIPLQSLTSIHLNSHLAREIVANGRLSYLFIFGGVGVFVLLMSAINFINLNTALSLKKIKEVAVRKVLGSKKSQLILYFLAQTNVTALFAALMAVLLIFYTQSIAGNLIDFQMDLIETGILAAGVAIFIGTLAGYFPSFILTRLKTTAALKSKNLVFKSSFSVRNALVAIQLTTCIVLISGALITNRQFDYLVNQNLGIEKEQLVAITDIPDQVKLKLETFKSQLNSIASVKGVTSTMEVPSREIRDTGVIYAEGIQEDPDTAPVMDMQVVDENFTEVMNLEVLAGRSVNAKSYDLADTANTGDLWSNFNKHQEYMINETAMKLIGWETPEEALGKQFSWSIGDLALKKGRIVGVVKDYHQETFRNKIDPMVFINEPVWIRNIVVKLAGGDPAETINSMKFMWDEQFPDIPFTYSYVDQLYAQLYKKEKNQMELIYGFTALAVIIAFLGLFGLISFTLHARMKELAIRKVLGANLSSLTLLLSKNFILLTIYGLVISTPLVWYLFDNWLQNFAYKVDIPLWVFIISFMAVLSVFIMTVFFQIVKTRNTNPAIILKGE